MTKERIEQIAQLIRSCDNEELEAMLSTLPEFQEPRWINCAKELPAPNVAIYKWHRDAGVQAFFGRDVIHLSNKAEMAWMPRYVPAPPVEDDSELVKELKKEINDTHTEGFGLGLNHAIEIVKRHEKKLKQP